MNRFLSFLTAAVVLLSLSACEPEAENNTTQPSTAPSNTRTVYVHTSVTKTSPTINARTEYLYDENDRLKEVVQYSGTSMTRRYNVECDENGNFTLWRCTVDTMELSIRYAYDSEGRSLGYSNYQDDMLISSTEYQWEDGLRTAIISVMPAQNRESRSEFTYNSLGYLVRQDSFVDGALVRYGICTVDEQGRVTDTSFYRPNGTAESAVTCVFDGLTETRTATAPDGTVTKKTVITYDEHGNLLSSVEYDGQGNLLVSESHAWKAIEVPLDCPRASA